MEKTDNEREKDGLLPVGQSGKRILSNREMEKICEIFQTLADPTRAKIVLALTKGALCVYHLAEVTGISVSGVSHQLRRLRENNVVKAKRFGKNVEYSLADGHIQEMLAMAVAHLACEE